MEISKLLEQPTYSISITELSVNLSRTLNISKEKRQPVIVTKRSQPMGIFIPLADGTAFPKNSEKLIGWAGTTRDIEGASK